MITASATPIKSRDCDLSAGRNQDRPKSCVS